MLIEQHGSGIPEGGLRQVNVIRTSAQKMGQLIDALLAFSRLGRQQLSVRPVAMEGLVSRVLDDLRADMGNRSVEVVVGTLPPCEGDLSLLGQVWMNLLSNALKFTRRKPDARIEVGAESVDGQATYYVRDNGAGFDMQFSNKLFGVFQRLHSADQFEGNGVGLAIVQRIVERHGGRIWATGAPDEGATFWFTIGRAEKS